MNFNEEAVRSHGKIFAERKLGIVLLCACDGDLDHRVLVLAA